MPRSELYTRLRSALRASDALQRHDVRADIAEELAWSRRNFLRTTATAAAAVAMFPRVLRADDDKPRVIILGAGAAGLTCAYRLQQSGIDATIYEASTRVGGRMYSLQNFFPDDQVAELGGELIDTDHHAIRNLARELNVELLDLTYLDGSNGHDYYIGGKLYKADADWIEAFDPMAKAIRRDIGANSENCDVSWNSGTEAGKALDNLSVAEWLDRNGFKTGAIRKVIEAAYVGEFGLELAEQSALNLLCAVGTEHGQFGIFGESNERYRTKGGNATIPIRLAQEIRKPVELGTVVEAIRNRGQKFEITVRRGGNSVAIPADIVVTTLPLPLMRKLDLTKLDLTAVQRGAIQNQSYGTNSKLMVGLNARPWVEMNISAYTFTDLAFQACWDTSRGQSGQHAILTNFSGGKLGASIGDGALQDRAKEFVAGADKVFPGVQSAYTGKAVRQSWPKYEWSQGSYACYSPGQYQRYFRGLSEPHGRLIFAGEHTTDESGFMNSAVESGERAATQVLAALGLAQIRAA